MLVLSVSGLKLTVLQVLDRITLLQLFLRLYYFHSFPLFLEELSQTFTIDPSFLRRTAGTETFLARGFGQIP